MQSKPKRWSFSTKTTILAIFAIMTPITIVFFMSSHAKWSSMSANLPIYLSLSDHQRTTDIDCNNQHTKKTVRFLCLVLGSPPFFDPSNSSDPTTPLYWKLFYNKKDPILGYTSDLLYMDWTWKMKEWDNISLSPNENFFFFPPV